MGAYTDGAKVLLTLGSSGKFAGQGDYQTAGIVAGAAGGQATVAYLKNTDRFGKASKDAFKNGAEILDYAITTVSLLELLLGLGSPDKGASFKLASTQVAQTSEDLAGASPDATWTGTGADAYSSANAAQQDRALQLSAADKLVATTLATEAAQVLEARRILVITKGSLIAAIPASVAMHFIPTNGETVSHLFQLILAIAAVSTSIETLYGKSQTSSATAAMFRTAISQYREVSASAASS
jgi:hypothetical protein